MTTATRDRDYAEAVCTLTETYLGEVTACAGHLPAALDAYGTDREEFAAAKDRIAARESDCDVALRNLRSTVAGATPNYTGVYLRVEDVVRLFAAIEGVPNSTERFVRELGAIGPTLSPGLRGVLREIAGRPLAGHAHRGFLSGIGVEAAVSQGRSLTPRSPRRKSIPRRRWSGSRARRRPAACRPRRDRPARRRPPVRPSPASCAAYRSSRRCPRPRRCS